ncbi:MAG: AI-2E family transporter [Verrucomicrobiia bacterium]
MNELQGVLETPERVWELRVEEQNIHPVFLTEVNPDCDNNLKKHARYGVLTPGGALGSENDFMKSPSGVKTPIPAGRFRRILTLTGTGRPAKSGRGYPHGNRERGDPRQTVHRDTVNMPIPKLKSSTATARALVGIWNVALTSFIIATLYLARDIIIPVTLAALLTFLLAPLVTRLERWLGRIGAVLLAVTLILAATSAAGWVLTRQLVDLATKLPDYKENIQAKLRSFKVPTGGRMTRFSETVEELKKELPGAETPDISQAPGKPTTAVLTESSIKPVVSVQVIESSKANPLQLVQVIIAPLLGPLGTAALVLLLVMFMLLKREDLRSRLIRLIGQGRISATTRAMGEAGARVTRYLLMQLLVNVTYGVSVAIGLYFIGVPNAVLWGACATVLRFIPYVGPWIGAGIPIALSLAVSPGWIMPLLTIGLFVVLELLSNNVMEPWLYGSSTGVTPLALIFAAVCWTWLWGPVGLVLATPMTVCLVVMGRHIPRLSFLSVLLSDEEALTPAEDCYYRLLTVGDQDEMELVEAYLKANSLTALFDCVFIPVVTAIEIDHRLELLDDAQHALVEQSLRDIVEDLGARPHVSAASDPGTTAGVQTDTARRRVCCLPARADRDELAGAMLAQLLQRQGFDAESAPTKLGVGELIGLVQKAGVDLVCISAVAPSTVLHARYLCLKLRTLFPKQKIVVGLWGATENVTDSVRRLRDSGADEVVTTLADAVLHLARLASPPPADQMLPEPIPADRQGCSGGLTVCAARAVNSPI